MPGQPGLSIVTFTPDKHSESADKRAILACWAASRDDDQPAANSVETLDLEGS
jgi:hypothetical protein